MPSPEKEGRRREGGVKGSFVGGGCDMHALSSFCIQRRYQGGGGILLKDGFCAAVEGVAGGVVLIDVDDGYSQKVYYQLIRRSYILNIYTLTFGR